METHDFAQVLPLPAMLDCTVTSPADAPFLSSTWVVIDAADEEIAREYLLAMHGLDEDEW